MEKSKVNELVTKYNEGLVDGNEIQLIEKLIQQGELDIAQLETLNQLDETINRIKEPVPSLSLDDRFYNVLAEKKRKTKTILFQWPAWEVLFPRLALACSFLVAGFLGGYWFHQPTLNSEIGQLTDKVEGLKEMMMISLLEKESATERLKAVSLTQEISDPSQQVTRALLKTLNADVNVNVRLAALDALQGYSNLPHVREGLVRSIALQNSPLVQMALAELMVAIQEKSSVSELKKALQQQAMPKEVKEKIQKSIDVLI